MKYFLAALWVLLITNLPAQANELETILQGDHRDPAFAKRDHYRHPIQTLQFFDLKPDMTVVEIWPGGGWYTELLAPYLTEGKLYAAHFPTGVGVPFYDKYRKIFDEKLAASPSAYQSVEVTNFDPKRAQLIVPDGAADRVLTFRNVHNWLRTESESEAFDLFFKALKPGGVLGVVEHRAKPDTDWDSMKLTGYMTEAYVIALAEKAGFVLAGQSEINANPADTKDHPKGVWSLPPSLRGGAENKETYLNIGESDRMTLKFLKPLN